MQRRMIADAAISTINRSGLDRTRLRDVARAGSVTTGTVTHYFDGKDAVLEAALGEIVRRTLERMNSVQDPAASMDIPAFVERVCCYLPVDQNSRQEWRVWLAFWGRAIADERLRAIHSDYYRKFVDGMVRHLKALEVPGAKVSLKTTRNCADAIIAALDGVGTRATLEPDQWPPRRQRQTLNFLLTPMLTGYFKEK